MTGPILAGFASTIVVLVAPSPETLPAGWLVLDCGVVSMGALLIALQLSFHAKAAWTTPHELLEWYPLARRDPEALEELRVRQHGHSEQWAWYQDRARAWYHAGLLFFLATVALVAVPADIPRVLPDFPIGRFVPALAGLFYLVVEVWWILSAHFGTLPFRGLFVAPPPTLQAPVAREDFRPDLYG